MALSSTPAPQLGFRADINGLRAVAVLAVLAFHFGVAPFAGGFVGVDVFFVISGYLMTGIILGRMARGSFSIPGFYLDRARRIVPALAALILATLVLGVFILLPDEMLLLAKQAGSAALFLSNVYYWRDSGYFDPGVDQKWLLHTWSLSVEWQFYLLYPLLLAVIARLAPRRLWAALLGGTAALSLALMLYVTARTSVDASFFLLPPRAWEMLVGGLVYLSPALPARATRPAQLAGLAAILAAAILSPSRPWPDLWTLVPVIGTALVILAGRTTSRVTGNPVAAWIGLNSYSIYLWHWPVVVLLKRSGHAAEWPWIAGALLVSVALGHLSWRFIESLARPRATQPHIHTAPIAGGWRPHAAFAVPLMLLVVMSAGIWKARGIPQRFSEAVRLVDQDIAPQTVAGAADCFSHGDRVPAPCVVGGDHAAVTLLGDSHAEAALPGLIAALPVGAGGVAYNAFIQCPPVLDAGMDGPGDQCGAFNERFLSPLAAAPRTTPVLLVSFWPTYVAERNFVRFPDGAPPSPRRFLDNLLRSSCALAAAGPTYVLMPLPDFPFAVGRELQHRLVRDPAAPDITVSMADYQARSGAVRAVFAKAAQQCGVKLLDPLPVLCPDGTCHGSIDHRALFRDDNHVSTYGAMQLAPLFRQIFTDRPKTAAATPLTVTRDQ